MKRFICVILAVMVIAAVFAACGNDAKVQVYKEEGATMLEAKRSEIKDIICLGSFNGRKDYEITGDKAWEIYDYLTGVTAKAEVISGVPEYEKLVHVWFKTKLDGADAELGVYQVYDNGAIVYADSMSKTDYKVYSCDKSVYDKVSEMLQ